MTFIKKGGKKLIDLTGQRFSRLTVLYRSKTEHKKNVPLWKCKCDCGTIVLVRGEYLRYGHTNSCGCYKRQRISETKFIHGMSQTKEHGVWRRMIQRCTNPKCPEYKYYGGRGIKLCERWMVGEGGLNGFQCFYADMGNRPDGLEIDRYPDVNGDYCRTNCRWTNDREQSRNKRNNIKFLWRGSVRCLVDICELEKVSYELVRSRVVDGKWSLKRAIELPSLGNWRHSL